MTSAAPDPPPFSRASFLLGPLDGQAGTLLGSPERVCLRHAAAAAFDDPDAHARVEALPVLSCVVYVRSGDPAPAATYVHAPDEQDVTDVCRLAKSCARSEAMIEGQRAARGE